MKKRIALHAACIICCILFCFLACAAQTSLLPHYLNDSYLVPDLLLCFVLSIGICANQAYGAFFGILAGVLADSTGGFGIFLLPLLYMLCGYGAGVAAELIPNKKFPVYLATGVIAALARAVTSLVYVALSSGTILLLDVTRYVCIPLFLGTCLALPAMYLPGLIMTLPVRKIKHDTIDKIL